MEDKLLGPYFHGLGKRRRHSDTSTDDDVPEKCDVFFSQCNESSLPKKRRINHLEAEVIPKFDSGKKTTNVKGWLNKIDQLGEMYSWDERDRIFVMQIRLRGSAREWYDDLEDYAATWTEWKEILTRAFPRSTDYVDRLEEMLARTKNNEETMTRYFHDKMSLLKKCRLEGDAATSCLIRGLPLELRANAKAYNCESPEELYYGFLSSLENYKKIEVKSTEQKSTWQRGSSMPKTCFKCRRTGHEARECRLTRCQICQRLGHASAACWYAAGSTGSAGSRDGHSSQAQRNVAQVRQVTFTTFEILSDAYKKYITINGAVLLAYIDTGSKVNIITLKTVQHLKLKISHSNVLMKGFGGSRITSLGKVQFNLGIDDIFINGDAEITNTDLKDLNMIIGQPIICRPNLTLIANSKIVKLIANNEQYFQSTHDLTNIQLSANDFIEKVPLFLSHYLELKPGDTCLIYAYITDEIHKNSMLITRSIIFDFGNESYFMPQCILKDGNYCLQITNLGETCIRWSVGRLLTRADVYDQAEVFITSSNQCSDVNINPLQRKTINFSNVKVGNIGEFYRNKLFHLLDEYSDSFAECSSELGCTNLLEMRIATTTDVPVYCKPYRLSYKESKIVEQKVDELVSAGIVRESDSEYASPVILVKKKEGDYRLCIDYRALNSRTVKDRYPLPHIDDQINRLSGKLYFTAIDLAQSYYQVKLSKDSIHKTAFITPIGQYEFLKMPFGLANAPAVFSRLIRKALGPLNNKLAIYLDDVTIPTVTIQEGIDLLEEVLRLLQQANLKLNLQKCSFLQTSVNYLGHEVTAGSVRPGQAKIDSVSQFRRPRNVHEVRQFIGLASYFRKFVRSFAEIARPLTYLTKKGVEWVWGLEQEQAFESLKTALTMRPVLAIYNPQAKTELHTDASKLGLGGILLQYQEDDNLKPVAYFSRVTSNEEQFYHSYELETLAVVESLKRFRIYLTGIPVKIVTDCAALRSTLTKKDLIPRIARWWLTIQDFDLDIEYRPGDRMRHVDALSRNPIDTTPVLSIDSEDWRLTLQLQDDYIQSIIKQLKEGTQNRDILNNYDVVGDCLFRKTVHGSRFVIPKLSKWSLLQKYHDQVGHPGFEKCEKAIKSQFWFLGMTKFIRKYINACLQCSFAKGNYGKPEGELHPIEKLQIPMHTIHADHLGPFLKTRCGNTYILVVIDAFTKFVFARPVRNVSSIETIKNLKEILSVFGNPSRIITDRGVAFTSRYFKDFVIEKQLKHVLNAIASPSSNGQVERVNRSIINGLNTTTESECTWDEKLADVVWGINNTPHAVTGHTPFNLMFAHTNTLLPAYPMTNSDHPNSIKQLGERRQEAKIRIDRYMTVMKNRYDKKHKSCRKYNVGDLVLWKGGISRDHTTGVTKKLGSCYTGPYKISKSDHSIDRYTINSIKGIKGYKKFSAFVPGDALRPYKSSVSDSSTDSDKEVDRDDLIDLLES